MSLEAALDEERCAILEILEGNSTKPHPKPAHHDPSYQHYRNAITGEPLTDLPPLPPPVTAPLSPGGSGFSRSNSPEPLHARSHSLGRHASPAPPAPPPRMHVVRSMLDIAAPIPPAAASPTLSAASPSPAPSPTARPRTQVIRSMLDTSAPLPPPAAPSPRSHSKPSPATRRAGSLSLSAFDVRRASDSAARALPDFRRTIAASAGRAAELPPNVGRDINGGYYDLDSGLPVRTSPLSLAVGAEGASSMASIMSGGELPFPGTLRLTPDGAAAAASALEDPLALFQDKKKGKKKKKKGKQQRRSLLDNSGAPPSLTASQFTTDSGQVIKFNEAYRKLSDAAIAKTSGALGQLYRASSQERSTGLKIGEGGEVRLAKDELDEDAIMSTDSSSENDDERIVSSSDEDDWRGRSRRKVESLIHTEEDDEDEDDDEHDGESRDHRKEKKREVRSLLAAAEEERKQVTYKYRSLLDGLPDPTKSRPSTASRHRKIHPATAFDPEGASAPNSAFTTPVGSEDEAEYSDIKKAQKLNIYLSPADTSVPNRVIQTIVRGEWSAGMAQLEGASVNNKKKLRTYLVATDLSEEAEYALEWTFGTIARDGDTVYVMYAIDEDVATKATSKLGAAPAATDPGELRDGKKVVADIAAVVGSQTEKTMTNPRPMRYSIAGAGVLGRSQSRGGRDSPRTLSTQRLRGGGTASARGSTSGLSASVSAGAPGGAVAGLDTARGLLEKERRRALERITSKCIHLLRKTRLQVRVAVEVIHCKNPKHLITEAIDGLQPTMVILGSRGRSALKGVLLGSFSNYLVSKSSKPVMVARKKLRKHATGSQYLSRQTNNLKTPRSLATAKIDPVAWQ